MAGRKKSKRRNSEKRKEKSRDAARSRRTKECEVFTALCDHLPLPPSQTQQLDKASVMRLAISHLKLRKLLGKDMTPACQPNDLQKKLDMQYQKALEGFVLVIAREGDIMYLSENVSKYLGITQVELIGQTVYDFTHPCDHDEIREILLEKPSNNSDTPQNCSFLMRMKCTLTSKGRNINLKSASYKVIRCTGRYVSANSRCKHLAGAADDHKLSCLLLIAEPIPHPSNIEVPLDSNTFISRHSLDMKFTHCDDRIKDLLGYESQSLINQSVFDFHHAGDSEHIRNACKDLFSKGQSVITNYRFLAFGGGYCQVQTEATVINNQRTDKPQYVVCINYVISGVEEKDSIMSPVQEMTPQCKQTSSIPMLASGVRLTTESIFVPKPKNMTDDILAISTTDDLLKLAPSAGSAMMKLEPHDMMQENTAQNSDPCPIQQQQQQQQQQEQPQQQQQQQPQQPVSSTSPLMSVTTDMSVLDLSFLNVEKSKTQDNQVSPGIYLSNKPVENTTVVPDLLVDDVDLDLRAPYIPMDGSDDQIFSSNWMPLVDEDMENSHMLGITETVFEPRPAEPDNMNNKIPLSILRLEASEKVDLPGTEIARNAGQPKVKRAMETNRLESGPPKLMRFAVDMKGDPGEDTALRDSSNGADIPSISDVFKDTPSNNGSSVLMNLLTKGEDVNFGYRIEQAKPISQLLLNRDDRSRLRSLLIDSSSDEDSDADFDDDESNDGDVVCDDDEHMSSPFSSDSSEHNKSIAPVSKLQPDIIQASQRGTPPGCANVVVISTDKALLFAPISSNINELPRIVGMKHN